MRGNIHLKLLRNVLFISCDEENVHLFDMETNNHIGLIEGPGGNIVSMEIVRNQVTKNYFEILKIVKWMIFEAFIKVLKKCVLCQVVVGTRNARFKAIPIAWSTFKNR